LTQAVKYGIWSSSQKNNHMLQDVYHSCNRRDFRRPIYFFYTVVNSDQYIGVAKMTTDVDFSKSFGYWWEKTKWNGVMNLQWIYVKDVQYSAFSNIYYMDKPVTHHRDGTRLDYETGMKMLKIYEKADDSQSIFDAFPYMDDREEKMRVDRDIMSTMNEPAKTSGSYHGSGNRDHGRHHRDRDGQGYYRKQNKYSGASEYHPKRKDNLKKDYYEEKEERSEEKNPGIVIQKKSTKSKKGKKNAPLYTKKEDQPTEKQDATVEQTHEGKAEDKEAKDETVTLPTSQN
jgi:YT521-B-like domain